ncbi:MAG: hypothetical protein ABJZ55_13755 [Fuerstiella sp.]
MDKDLTRVFPQSVTPTDVSALVAELREATPYSDDNWKTASFDFDTHDLVINIRLPDGRVGPPQIKRLEAVIRILPELQTRVIEIICKPENAEPNDDHGLAWIDIDVEDGDVDLCYNGIAYNTQWNYAFRVSNDGTWSL